MTSSIWNYRLTGKRLLDLAVVVPLCVVALPICLAVSLVILCTMGRPIFFRQKRIGLNEREFGIFKFRTMTMERDSAGKLLPDEQRLKRLGLFLRSTSLDELPQLWNVLRGDMAIVGPRPLLPEYLEFYTPEQKRRHTLRPGITGWAQVNGRNAIDWETKFALDGEYVQKCSLSLDLRIWGLTLKKVISRGEIGHASTPVMPRFDDEQRQRQRGVLVIGAGGHACVVISTLLSAQIKIDAIYDDAPEMWGQKIHGIPVKGAIREIDRTSDQPAIIAVGCNATRKKLAQDLPLNWISAVHSHAYVDPSAQIGCGAVIMAGAVVQSHAVVGEHAIINSGSVIEHHGQIGNFAHVGPGTCMGGKVTIGAESLIGCGTSIKPGVQIGQQVTVGAGACVVKNLPDGVLALGVPAVVTPKVTSQKRAA